MLFKKGKTEKEDKIVELKDEDELMKTAEEFENLKKKGKKKENQNAVQDCN